MPDLDTQTAPAKSARARAASRELRYGAIRGVQMVERRDDQGAVAGFHLSGYASVTEEPYEMADWLGPYTEVVRAGAFRKTLAEKADVRLLVNHDGIPLARTKSETLTLTEIMPAADVETSGLWCEADLDASSPLVQEIRSAMARGDLDEMSFAFRVTRQQWSPDYEQRDILEVELFDVSVVTYPANPATSATLRSAVAGRAQMLVPAARARAIAAELREGKTLSADTLAVLQQVLDLIAAADEAVDEAQPVLADLMGVPNPDDDDPEDTDSGDEPDDSLPNDDGSEPRSAAVEGERRDSGLSLFEHRLRALDAA